MSRPDDTAAREELEQEQQEQQELLLQKARRDAIQELRAHLFSSQQLARLPNLRSELQQKYDKLQQQLSSALRAQMEEIRLGLDLLQQAGAGIQSIQERFDDVAETCLRVREHLDSYDEVAGIHIAKRNLERTQELLAAVRRLPDTVDSLIETAIQDETAIKDVYLAYRQLVRLRDMSLAQSEVFAEDFELRIKESFQILDEVGEEILFVLEDTLKHALDIAQDSPLALLRALEVIEMEDRAERKVLELSKSRSSNQRLRRVEVNPREALLRHFKSVMAGDIAAKFQMPKMDEEHSHLEEEKSPGRGRSPTTTTLTSTSASTDPRSDSVNTSQSQQASPRIGSDTEGSRSAAPATASTAEEEEEEAEEEEEMEMERARRLRELKQQRTQKLLDYLKELKLRIGEELPFIDHHVVPLFPPRWEIQKFYAGEYYRMADIALQLHLTDPASMTYREILESVRWLQWYRWQRLSSELPEMDSDMVDNIRALMITYLDIQKDGFSRKIDKIIQMQKEEEPERSSASSSQLTLNGRNDLFTFINLQLKLLEQFDLHGEAAYCMGAMLADVVDFYSEVLLGFLNDFLIDQNGEPLTTPSGGLIFGQQERLEKSEEWLIALLNDAKLSVDHVEDMVEKLRGPIAAVEMDSDSTDPVFQQQQHFSASSAAAAARGVVPSALVPGRDALLKKRREAILRTNEELVAAMEERLWACQDLQFEMIQTVQGLLVMQNIQTVKMNMERCLFKEQWLESAGVLEVEVLLALDQFIGDFSNGIHESLNPFISQRFVPPVLKPVMANVISLYMKYLWQTPPKYSPKMVRRIKEDWISMQKMFEDWPITRPSDFVEDLLHYLGVLAQALESTEDFFESCFRPIMERFDGISARQALIKVMILRSDITKQSKDEFLQSFDEKYRRHPSMHVFDYDELIAQSDPQSIGNPWVEQPLQIRDTGERRTWKQFSNSSSYDYLAPVSQKLDRGTVQRSNFQHISISKFADGLRRFIRFSSDGSSSSGQPPATASSSSPSSSSSSSSTNAVLAASKPSQLLRKRVKDTAPAMRLSDFL